MRSTSDPLRSRRKLVLRHRVLRTRAKAFRPCKSLYSTSAQATSESVVANKEAVYRIAGQPFKAHSIRDKWLNASGTDDITFTKSQTTQLATGSYTDLQVHKRVVSEPDPRKIGRTRGSWRYRLGSKCTERNVWNL